MSIIHLIGTIHYDLKGIKRLEKALNSEKPDIITIEANQEWLNYLSKNWNSDKKIILNKINKIGLKKTTTTYLKNYLNNISNYEINVCIDYFKKKIFLYILLIML